MVRIFLFWLTARLRVKVIEAEVSAADPTQEPLFERYHLCRLPGGGAVYIHHYLRADPDRGLHDHPWSWAIALPIAGGYFEERLSGITSDGLNVKVRWRRPGIPYWLTGHDFHKIEGFASNTSSWSIFIRGPDTKRWGFLRSVWVGVPGECGDFAFAIEPASMSLEKSRWQEFAPLGRYVRRAGP